MTQPQVQQHTVDWLLAALTGRAVPALPLTPEPWPDLLRFATEQGLAPLLWARLQERSDAVDAPPAFLANLRTLYLANAARNMRHVQELAAILRAMHEAGIQVILLKGLCLAQLVYGNLALRTVGDADLLVPAARLEQAATLLQKLRYIPETAYSVRPDEQYFQHLPPFRKPGALAVELHWALFPVETHLFALQDDLEAIWLRSLAVMISNTSVHTLAPEDMLLHLCLHASAHHQFLTVHLRCCFDVAEVVHRFNAELDWDVLCQRAAIWRCKHLVYLVLLLSQQLAGAIVPLNVMQALQPAALPQQVIQRATDIMLGKADGFTRSERLVHLSMHPGSRDTLHALWTAFFPPRAKVAYDYPVTPSDWHILLYYPVRWWRLYKDFGHDFTRLARRDFAATGEAADQELLVRWLRDPMRSSGTS